MGLMLSLLIGCAGVIEALACYQSIKYGLLPKERADFDNLRRAYNSMVAESLSKPQSRSEAWKVGSQGYLEIKGGGKDGPIKAQIKYLGSEGDPTSLLFSTKISSFGQESVESDTKNYSPDRSRIQTQIPQGQSVYLDHGRSSPRLSPVASADNNEGSFWDDEEEPELEQEQPKEKIQWHYRPLTPSNESSLPEIQFDSYEGNDADDGSNSEDFLRSDAVKFRPLQRDDGTGRRRSFKKRHSSSSTSSRESKASREEELKIFTSLEESEFESYNTHNLTADAHSKRKSKSKSKDKSRSPSLVLQSNDNSFEANGRRSPSSERPLLGELPKHGSFDEDFEDATNENGLDTNGKDEDESVVFRKAGVNE